MFYNNIRKYVRAKGVMMYKGIIVEQSLTDKAILNSFDVIKRNVIDAQNWVETTVFVTEEQIEKLSSLLRDGWYMHFWCGRSVKVIFKNKVFKINYDDKSTWESAVEYGMSIGIPAEQLDFPIDD